MTHRRIVEERGKQAVAEALVLLGLSEEDVDTRPNALKHPVEAHTAHSQLILHLSRQVEDLHVHVDRLEQQLAELEAKPEKTTKAKAKK